MGKIVLASASPRRRELLLQIGVDFEVIPSKGEEVVSKTAPGEVVKELAFQKAKEVAKRIEELDTIVIGSDTIVTLGQEILGKPKDNDDAFRMLSLLQGNTHSVYTGVAVLKTGYEEEPLLFYEQTKVTMYPMAEDEIKGYIATKDPMDKAGSYGIQGICARFIKEISGDYNNVVGLPVGRLYQECKKAGIELIYHD